MNNEIDYNLADVIKAGIRANTVQMFVALPATVQSFDLETQTISAKISIDRIILDEIYKFPVLTQVPVVFNRSNTAGFSFKLNEGDEVMLHFIQRSTGNWRSKGPGHPPDTGVFFNINDAVAYPCVHPQKPTYKLRKGTEVIGEKLFLGNPNEKVIITNAKGSGDSPIELDLVQVVAAILGALQLESGLLSSMGPVKFDPTVLADFKALEDALKTLKTEST